MTLIQQTLKNKFGGGKKEKKLPSSTGAPKTRSECYPRVSATGFADYQIAKFLDGGGAREARRAPEAPAQVTIGTILPQLNHYPDFTSNIYSGSVTGVYFSNNFSPMALQDKISWL